MVAQIVVYRRSEVLAVSNLLRSVRPKRWQVVLIAAVLVLCAASLVFISRKESRWHVSIEPTNWGIYTSEDLIFTEMAACVPSPAARLTLGRWRSTRSRQEC